MAVKAIGQIRSFDWQDVDGMNITLRIFNLFPAHTAEVTTGYIGIDENDAASVINTKLAAFIKQYCIDTWDATFNLGDTVRLLAAVDSIL